MRCAVHCVNWRISGTHTLRRRPMRFVFPVKISRSCSFARISLSRRVLSTCFRTSVCVASLAATPYRAVAQAETADVHEMRSTALPATRPLESSANRLQGHTNPSFLGSGHAPERVHLLPLSAKASCSLGGEIIAPCTSSRSVSICTGTASGSWIVRRRTARL